ncbi:MAG: DNA polymerase Y family protein [Acidimicrobiia bacterium]
MERTICVWYPTWALLRPDVSREAPAQAIGADGKVIACNEWAADAGITVGMLRRSAEALCPTVVTVVQDHTAEMARFEPVVDKIESMVPRVEVAMPGLLFLPIAGAVAYYGGEQPLVERIDKELAVCSEGHRLGVALGPFAAQQAARLTSRTNPIHVVTDDDAFLTTMDVGAIGSEDLAATFRWLGIGTLGELASLPKDALISRFGRKGLDAHRIASGEDRAVTPRDIPENPTVVSVFDPPIQDMEQASFAARNLSQRLISGLAVHGIAPHRVVVTAEAADGTIRSRSWRSGDPFDDRTLAERVRWQLRAWIDGVSAGIRGGLVSLTLEPDDLSGSGRQMALEEDAKGFEETQRALMEVQAIAGQDNLLIARPQGGRDPAQQVLWERWGDEPSLPVRDPSAPWPGAIPGPVPALVPPEAVRFEVTFVDGIPEQVRLRSRWVPVLSWAGPWRSVGRWWDGEGPADRYQIVTSAGAYLCEIRDSVTYLLGVYD